MPLAKSISQFRIVANGTNHDIDTQNMDLDWEPEDYTEPPTSLGGKKYKNMAGLRAKIEIRHNQSLQESEWRSLINDIITHFVTNGNDSMEFYPDNTNLTSSDKIDVIPTDSTYKSLYKNQTGTFVPSLSLEGVERATTISSNFGAP